jgi:primosomal protein N' (replication factor Y)
MAGQGAESQRLAFRARFSHCGAMTAVQVLLPMALTGPYDYELPENMEAPVGAIVRVPLGKRQVDGVVWGPALGDVAPEKLRPILSCHPVAPLAPDLMAFMDWMANYVMAPRGAVLNQVMRVPSAFEAPRPLMAWRAGASRPARMTEARARVFAVLADTPLVPTALLAERAQVSAAVITGLARDGHILAVPLPEETPQQPQLHRHGITLTEDQTRAAQALAAAVSQKTFSTHLLDGVTGAGKTEVYFEAIDAALMAGRQALVLLPEISLTNQFLERFAARFGVAPAVWHSGLTMGERRRLWRDVSAGKISVLVGARSALFLPWSALGVIIVDEEHDAGFKQEDGLIYNARDMAIVRARFAQAACILASATPSLETAVNAREGRYQRHHLEARIGAAGMPEMAVVDMRSTPPEKGRWLVPQMIDAIRDRLANQEQALVFLNRRGYAPLTICRQCGHRYACGQCDAWMVEHRFRRELMCHHCGTVEPKPEQCVSCGAVGTLAACGPGIEQVTEEVIELFPQARVAVLSSDLRGGAAVMRRTLAQITAGEVDIIVGTQIVAKGHHFPHLGFVGVVDADLGLGNGDLRASERTYQLLSQVAGRAGREAIKGAAMLQSYMPDHPVLQALIAGDRDQFLAREATAREAARMPPFGRLAALILSSPRQEDVVALSHNLARRIPRAADIDVLGPAPAPIARLRNRFRYRFLVRAQRSAPMQAFIRQWLSGLKMPNGARLSIDIDPYNFL